MTVRGYRRADQRQRPSSRDRNAAIDCQHRLYSPRTIGTVLLGAFDDLTTVGWLPSRQLLMLAGECFFVATMRDIASRAVSLILLVLPILGLAGCNPSERNEPKFGSFYRMSVELSHGNEPLNIEVIIGCGSEVRQILGEGRSARGLWAPYIFGVRARNGEGVLVQSPDICGRELAKQPMPADFLPVVLWAPDVGNLEYLVAYLNERAYQQPVSKLTFHKATFTDATKSDYEVWRNSRWKDNIVPLNSRDKEYNRDGEFFHGEGFFPKGDPRSEVLREISCHAVLRVPLPDGAKAAISEKWPAERPRFWLLDWTIVAALQEQYPQHLGSGLRRNPQWDREMPGFQPNFSKALGVNRASGIGHIVALPSDIASGRGLRIPYRLETGYPWASDRLKTQQTLDVNFDTANGADQGFAYCFRDMWSYYRKIPGPVSEVRPADQRYFIDGQLVGTLPNDIRTAPGGMIVERDQYLWLPDLAPFPLTNQLGRMQ